LKRPFNIAEIAVLLACTLLSFAFAEESLAQAEVEPHQTYEEMAEELSPGVKQIRLSLEDCIATALKNNLDIEVEGYFPRINETLIQSEKGVFDPYLYFNATYVNRMDPLPVMVSVATGGLTAVETEQWLITGGLAGAIPTGLTYDINVESTHTPFSTTTDFLNANKETRLESSLTISQPLLKGFGMAVNTTGIHVAVKNQEASVYQLQQRILDTVFAVEQAYWELVFSYENLRVKMKSLRLAQNLLDENRIRLKVGVIAPLAVLQSETGVVVREQELIVAQARVRDARDRLIQVVNLFPEQLLWDVEIVPADEPLSLPSGEYSEGEQISIALRNRPELKLLLKQQEAADLGARFAKNQLLPSLNLNASVGLIGLDDDFDASFFPAFFGGLPLPPSPDKGIDPAVDDLFSGDNVQWTVGFTFELPWGRHYERGQHRIANLQVSQLDAGIQNTRQLIIQDTRAALRGVDTNWQRVVSARETVRFRRESLLAERKKFEVGVSTAHDLLEFEEELAQAEANERRATIDYVISMSNLLRATGTLLQARNVELSVGS